MVGTAQFSRILVLDIGRGGESIGRAAEAALHRRSFSFRNSHFINSGPATAPTVKGRWGERGNSRARLLQAKARKGQSHGRKNGCGQVPGHVLGQSLGRA